jgi:hypothetical protein
MHGRYEALGAGVNITEFKYRMNGTATAQILFSVTVKTPQEVSDIQVRPRVSVCHSSRSSSIV